MATIAGGGVLPASTGRGASTMDRTGPHDEGLSNPNATSAKVKKRWSSMSPATNSNQVPQKLRL